MQSEELAESVSKLIDPRLADAVDMSDVQLCRMNFQQVASKLYVNGINMILTSSILVLGSLLSPTTSTASYSKFVTREMGKVEALLKRILEFKGLKKADQQSILDDFNKHWRGMGWSTEGCLEQERFALLQLKPFFYSPSELENWVEGDHNSDCCQWDRVECNNDTTKRVISLGLFQTRDEEMGEWYLNASLFSTFQQLQWLDLSYNGIAGCVENEGFDKLSTLSNLEALYLGRNSFNNSILSSLSTLSSLKNLSLSYNKLKGIVDLQGWRLSNLEYLSLSGNIFNNNILSSLSALSSLKTLYLRDVGLEGSVDLSGY
ncbi:hypothetical protein LWI29_021256 [Acer saccharum]|uniref:Leucine-rich repeat-containing N-terminal plant-type domain-containing protein n=1 Tax=Acer saccharum TaxID=4024 RepID=A0AA39RDT5_ACESA|nr:hypothetical protein LWI29_021256 [Acer saccharum]